MNEVKSDKNIVFSTWKDDKHINVTHNNSKIISETDKWYQQSCSISLNNKFVYGLGEGEIIQYDIQNETEKLWKIDISFQFTKYSIILCYKNFLFLFLKEDVIDKKENHLIQFDIGKLKF